jgi:heme/copper-type cytochrome/quinol oxidase subunit 2
LSSALQFGTIIAGVLGGILLTLIVGLIIYFIWKRRAKKKSLRFSGSTSTEATIPPMELVVVPALYDLSLSRQNSYETSTGTVNYHLYDELS